jgi:hypothetical protein
MNGWDSFKDLLPFLIPVILLEFGLMIYALVDVTRRKRIKGDSRVMWILIIVLVNIIGPIVYLLAGREKEEAAD